MTSIAPTMFGAGGSNCSAMPGAPGASLGYEALVALNLLKPSRTANP